VTGLHLVEAESAARLLLNLLGIDTTSDGLDATPRRMVQALAELTAGLRDPADPADVLDRTFPAPADHPQMIVMRGIRFTSVCEHHMLPFHGSAVVGYLPFPGRRVVGASKLARLVEGYAVRPQMQERLGEQVTAAIMGKLAAQGAGCLLTATHTCLTLRGARSASAMMVTSHLAGCFKASPVREEFLALSRGS
jgi:GTP cyclohydrolase IA